MDLQQISLKLQAGKARDVKALVQQAIDEGVPAHEILEKGLVAGMNVIGEKFKNNEVFVPEVLVAARAMNMGASLLKPLLAAEGVKATGKVCIGTVKGDLHDVAPETFINTARDEHCQLICCSALLTTTMGAMADVVEAAKDAGIRDQVKIMVGGAPVTEAFCKQIGADAYTPDAATAAEVAVQLCSK